MTKFVRPKFAPNYTFLYETGTKIYVRYAFLNIRPPEWTLVETKRERERERERNLTRH